MNFLAWATKFGAGMLLPGFLLSRLVGSSAVALSSFLGSAGILFLVVLALDAAHIPLTGPTISAGLAVVSAGLLLAFFLVRRRASQANRAQPAPEKAEPRERRSLLSSLVLWTPVALAASAISARALADPLSGYDNVFRWDFIAHQVLRLHSLSFYPAVTASDFSNYAWCDGIPPLVSFFNLWSYLSAGNEAAISTAPRVMLEAGLLFYATYLLAVQLGGKRAGPLALAALGTSSLALWGVAMGQETGLTALSLVSMLVFLGCYERTHARSDLFWAATAASVGAISREYGLAWIAIGLLILWRQGNLRRTWPGFIFTAFMLSSPWYFRNWAHTGNPLFSYELAGLFPVNPAHVRIMAGIKTYFFENLTSGVAAWAIAVILITAGPTLFIAGFAIGRLATAARSVLWTMGIIIGLWAWAMPQTAGGIPYATRVLTPAVALAAALVGSWAANGRARRWPIPWVLLALAADASFRSLHLPDNPLLAPWNLRPSKAWQLRDLSESRSRSRLWPAIAEVAAGRPILIDNPAFFHSLLATGAKVIPIQSPAVAALFDPRLTYREVLARLRLTGLRLIILTPQSMATNVLNRETAFLAQLRRDETPVLTNGEFMIFDLDFVTAK